MTSAEQAARLADLAEPQPLLRERLFPWMSLNDDGETLEWQILGGLQGDIVADPGFVDRGLTLILTLTHWGLGVDVQHYPTGTAPGNCRVDAAVMIGPWSLVAHYERGTWR